VARGQTLSALPVPEQDPGPSWFLSVLADAPLPHGVRADPRPGYHATTLCTFIADLTAGQAVIANRGEPPVTIPLRDMAEGHPPHLSNPGCLTRRAVSCRPSRQLVRPLLRQAGHDLRLGQVRLPRLVACFTVIGRLRRECQMQYHPLVRSRGLPYTIGCIYHRMYGQLA